ncbi:D-hexose-6-phosphate mutarotase [Propioniciclava soli]|uniref:Putative glucose-6-phosphate 1-epimerase n=1 Tax=Propioniciclava soli TaxID=2775081 RepID=A0ABZ3C5G4_9ACTN
MAFETTTNPMRGVEAKHGSGHYGVFEHGAHIWSYQPDGQAPVLWLSAHSAFSDDQPIRGGVPVIFPWFGPGEEGDPAHGFVRTATWHLQDTKDTLERDGRLLVEYELDQAMTGRQDGLPHRYRAYLRAKFTPEYLGITLEINNTGENVITFENALHTYLAVGDVREVTVSGLDGATYFDKVTGETQTQSGDITITGETDRVYTSEGEVVVHDPVLGRTLVIAKSGSANTVVWNPWVDKAKAMPDFGDDEWTGMLCIEAANCRDGAITLRPGEMHQLRQRIALA